MTRLSDISVPVAPDRVHKYKNPPIQEAVCEIHLAINEPLSTASIERLQIPWGTAYPDQKITEEKNVELQMAPDGVRVAERDLGRRLICRSVDGMQLVQLSGRFVAVNQLRPYGGWEESFRHTILSRFDEVHSRLGPFLIARTNLRYINRIDVPEHPLNWENWFNFSLPNPKIEDSTMMGVQMHFEHALPEQRKLIVNCVIVPPPRPGVSSVILDLEVGWQGEPVASNQLPKVLDHVHSPHRLAFEAYINNNLRQRFDDK